MNADEARRERAKNAVETIRAACPVRTGLDRCDHAAEDAVRYIRRLEDELKQWAVLWAEMGRLAREYGDRHDWDAEPLLKRRS